MVDCRSVSTPPEVEVKLIEADCPVNDEEKARMEQFPHRSKVGSLMYLAVCTSPDISAAVSMLSRINANPGEVHWESAVRVLRYFRVQQVWACSSRLGSSQISGGKVVPVMQLVRTLGRVG